MLRLISILLVVVLGAPTVAHGMIGLPGSIDFVSSDCCCTDGEREESEQSELSSVCCCRPSPVEKSPKGSTYTLESRPDFELPPARPLMNDELALIFEAEAAPSGLVARGPPARGSLFAQRTLLLI